MSKACKKTPASKGGASPKHRQNSHDPAPGDDDEEEQEYRGRGRPKGSTYIEDYWTRVLSPCYRQIDHEAKFDIKVDLANELLAQEEHGPYHDNISWPIFMPDEWARE